MLLLIGSVTLITAIGTIAFDLTGAIITATASIVTAISVAFIQAWASRHSSNPELRNRLRESERKLRELEKRAK